MRRRHSVTIILGSGLIVTFSLFLLVIFVQPSLQTASPEGRLLEHALFWQGLLPRSAVAILAGAALGLAGMLLQRALRNPIADPSTMGIAAGAQLALASASLAAPALFAATREGVALFGGLVTALLVLSLSWRRGFEPVTVILSGMVVSMIASALSATIILAQGDYVLSLYIWGAGALQQQNWDATHAIAWRLACAIGLAAMLLRPLNLLGLDDAGSKNLGFNINLYRLLIIALAVWLCATVTAQVGVIGFIGLAAPALARICGFASPRQLLWSAPVFGALLLSGTDSAVQILSPGFSDLAPTGAATALFGGPLLLWLLPRLPSAPRPLPSAPHRTARLARPVAALMLLSVLMPALAILVLMVGRNLDGWHSAVGQVFVDLLPFRWPRIIAAAAAGAMLAAAGTLIQRITGNPMGSPEILGVSAGGGVGLAAMILIVGFPGPTMMMVGLAVGALGALLLILLISARSGFSPDRFLLAGIAIGASCMAFLGTILSGGGMASYMLLTWMTGSTNNIGPVEALTSLGIALALIFPILLLSRWLDVMSLGMTMSQSLGLSQRFSRLSLACLAALLTAASSAIVGPLSLIGLVAPHIARRLGFARGLHHLLSAVLIGAMVLMFADWLSRIVIFPYQVPLGLFAALIGGPYLIWLLNGKGRQHG